MLNINVDDHYEYPAFNLKPFKAQKITTNFLVNHPHSFCFNDMGTGKTLAALWAADFLMRQFPKGQVQCLILAPLSTLNTVWRAEIKKHFFGRRTVAVVHGSSKRRVLLLKKDFDFYVINHDGPKLKHVEQILATKETIRIVIIDEASTFRNSTTDRSKVIYKILSHKPYVWAMTGTPTPNGPADAHGIAKLVKPDLEITKTEWKHHVMIPVSPHHWEPAPQGYNEARKLLRPAVRFSRAACVDLPPNMPPVRLEAPFTAHQQRLYEELKRNFRAEVAKGGGVIDAVHEGALRLKLLQIACGAVYDADRQAHRVDAGPRLAVLKEAIEAAPGKVLIFAPFTSALLVLYDFLKPWSREIVSGKVSLGQRTKIFQSFQTSKSPHLIIADPGTMSHGLTLTSANTIIWWGPTDKSETYMQANARISRPGQTKTTFTVQISSCKEENRIYDKLQNNESLQGSMLSLME